MPAVLMHHQHHEAISKDKERRQQMKQWIESQTSVYDEYEFTPIKLDEKLQKYYVYFNARFHDSSCDDEKIYQKYPDTIQEWSFQCFMVFLICRVLEIHEQEQNNDYTNQVYYRQDWIKCAMKAFEKGSIEFNKFYDYHLKKHRNDKGWGTNDKERKYLFFKFCFDAYIAGIEKTDDADFNKIMYGFRLKYKIVNLGEDPIKKDYCYQWVSIIHIQYLIFYINCIHHFTFYLYTTVIFFVFVCFL
jgi:hypothetical protein